MIRSRFSSVLSRRRSIRYGRGLMGLLTCQFNCIACTVKFVQAVHRNLCCLETRSMDNGTMTLLLRLTHILAGVFWVGAIFLIAGFLLPTARATGREGGR